MDFIEEDVCKILEGLKECRVVEENDELDGDDLINVSKMGYLDTDEDWLMRSSIMDNTSSSSSSLLLTSSNLNNKDSNLISITRLLNESEKEYNLMNTSTILEDQASPDLVSLISSVHTTSEVIQQQGRHTQEKQGKQRTAQKDMTGNDLLYQGEDFNLPNSNSLSFILSQNNDDYLYSNISNDQLNSSLGLLEAEECSFQYPSLNEHQLEDNLLSLQQQQQQQQNSSVSQQQEMSSSLIFKGEEENLFKTSLSRQEFDIINKQDLSSNHRGEGEDNKNSIIMFNSLEMNDDLLLNSDATAISCSNNSSSSSSSSSLIKAQSTDLHSDFINNITMTFKEDELTREREDLDCTFKVKDDKHELNNQTFNRTSNKNTTKEEFCYAKMPMPTSSPPPPQVNEKDTFKTFKKSDLRMFKQLAKEGREPSSSSSLESTFITTSNRNDNTYININTTISEDYKDKMPSSKSLDGTFISRQQGQQKTNLQSAFNSKLMMEQGSQKMGLSKTTTTTKQHLATTNNKDKEKENEDFLNKLQTQQSQLNQEEDIRQYNLNVNAKNNGLLNTATFKRIKKPSSIQQQEQEQETTRKAKRQEQGQETTTKAKRQGQGEEDKDFINKLEQTFLMNEFKFKKTFIHDDDKNKSMDNNSKDTSFLKFLIDDGRMEKTMIDDELCQKIDSSFGRPSEEANAETFIGSGSRTSTGTGIERGRVGGVKGSGRGGGGGGSEESLLLKDNLLLLQEKTGIKVRENLKRGLKGAQSNDDLLFDDREINKSSSSSSMTSFLAREELEALKRKANRSNENLDCTFSCPNAVAQDAYLHQIDINELSSSNNKKTPTMPLLPNRSKTFKKSSQERPQIVVLNKKKTANEEIMNVTSNSTNIVLKKTTNEGGGRGDEEDNCMNVTVSGTNSATNIDTRTFRRPSSSSSNNKFLREQNQQHQMQRRSMNVELINDGERSILATSSPVSSNSVSSQRMESVPFSPIVKDASLMRRQQLQFNQFHAQESQQQQHIKQPIIYHQQQQQHQQVLKQQNPIVVNNVAQQRQMPVPSSHHHHHQLPLQQQQQATTTVTTGIPRLKPRSRLPIPRR